MKQLILIKAVKSRCEIFCMEKRKDKFYSVKPVIHGWIGKGGTAKRKREGDLKTPLGLFPVGSGFGISTSVKTGLIYNKIGLKDRWCCDSKSRYYNRFTNKRSLKQCEDMWKYRKEYRLGFVVEYNTGKNREPFCGSAIFFHCGNKATSGCIAAEKSDVEKIMRWLDRHKKPYIYICNAG